MIGVYNEKAEFVSVLMKVCMVFLILGVVKVSSIEASSNAEYIKNSEIIFQEKIEYM